jgi:hypothetical protein
MPLSRGAVGALAACQRLVWGLAERAHAGKTARRAAPPPSVRVDGRWRPLAVPTGESPAESRGRTRAGQRNPHRVMLPALGLWPDGPGARLAWPLAANEAAASWGALVGTLSPNGGTAPTTPRLVSDGSQGLDKALSHHR